MKSNKGFTLIELLVVVAIIGVLATVVLSSLSEARAHARDARRESDIKTIQTALEMYHLDNGHYPDEFSPWRHSGSSSHRAILTSALTGYLPEFPHDPSNGTGAAYSGNYAYSYYGNSSITCNGQAYMLVYNKETSNGTSSADGVRLCNGSFYTYGNAFVVGMNRDGVLRFN